MTVERLKRDHFGAIDRIRRADGSEFIRRDTGAASPGLRWLARAAARREARALAALDGIAGVPLLLRFDGRTLERSLIAGAPMHEAQPRHPRFYRHAHRLLKAIRARGVVHNDLAKEANWIVASDGTPAVVDFQLAWASRRRGRLFRLLSREGLRHLLKHKRTYCPESLTPTERRVLARRGWIGEWWRRTGKRLYILVARRILHWEDNEARGRRGAAIPDSRTDSHGDHR